MSPSSFHKRYQLFLKRVLCSNLRHWVKRVKWLLYRRTRLSLWNSHVHCEFLAGKNPRLCRWSSFLRASVVFLEHTSRNIDGEVLGGWVGFIPSQWPTLRSDFSFAFLNKNPYCFLFLKIEGVGRVRISVNLLIVGLTEVQNQNQTWSAGRNQNIGKQLFTSPLFPWLLCSATPTKIGWQEKT